MPAPQPVCACGGEPPPLRIGAGWAAVSAALCWQAPAVAVLWQVFITAALGVHVPWNESLLLAAAVWTIYQGDHLLDALRADPARPMPARHRFARQHFGALLGAVLLVALLGGVLALATLGSVLLPAGLALGAACLGYLLLVQWPPARGLASISKELASSALFAGGVFLAPLARYPAGWSPGVLLAAAMFAALCWFNMLEIGLEEAPLDRAQDNLSAIRALPVLALILPILEIGTAVLGGLLGLDWGVETAQIALQPLFLAMSLSGLLLAIVHRFNRRRHCPRVSVRFLADAALLTPLLWV